MVLFAKVQYANLMVHRDLKIEGVYACVLSIYVHMPYRRLAYTFTNRLQCICVGKCTQQKLIDINVKCMVNISRAF